MKCRINGCTNEAWPAWNTLCRECQAEMDWQPSDEDGPQEQAEDYEEREEGHGK